MTHVHAPGAADPAQQAEVPSPGARRHWWRPRRVVSRAFKIVAFVVVLYFVLFNIPGLRRAFHEAKDVNPAFLVAALALEIAALFCYSLMTRSTLGDDGRVVSAGRMFRIQMSTRALSSLMPGGSATGSALGYRLMTLSGIEPTDAGFGLATASLVSAVVLNVILWIGLIVSIPIRGVNPFYGTAAVVGIIIMGFTAAVVFGLTGGQGRAERVVGWIARKLHLNDQKVGEAVRHVRVRLEDFTRDRKILLSVLGWAAANWLLDAAALWMSLRAFGGSIALDGLIVAFGIANLVAVIPITPGGLGIVEGVYIPTLVGFGLTRANAAVGVVSYRIAQFWFPILLGGFLYLTLRVGHFSIDKRDGLQPLRKLAEEGNRAPESKLDFTERLGSRGGAGGPTNPG